MLLITMQNSKISKKESELLKSKFGDYEKVCFPNRELSMDDILDMIPEIDSDQPWVLHNINNPKILLILGINSGYDAGYWQEHGPIYILENNKIEKIKANVCCFSD